MCVAQLWFVGIHQWNQSICGAGNNSFLPLRRCGSVSDPGSSLLVLHCIAFVLEVKMVQDMGCDVSVTLLIGFMVVPFPAPNTWKKWFHQSSPSLSQCFKKAQREMPQLVRALPQRHRSLVPSVHGLWFWKMISISKLLRIQENFLIKQSNWVWLQL